MFWGIRGVKKAWWEVNLETLAGSGHRSHVKSSEEVWILQCRRQRVIQDFKREMIWSNWGFRRHALRVLWR